MVLSIGSNTTSLLLIRQLGVAREGVTGALHRLSSGFRINQASDDAASLQVAAGLQMEERVAAVGIRNLSDGISLLSIAGGALDQLALINQRQLELATEAANGSLSLSQRRALNTEANALVDEFNRIVATTTFNGRSVFNPNESAVSLQGGSAVEDTLTISLGGELIRQAGTGYTEARVDMNTPLGGMHLFQTAADVNGDGRQDLLVTPSSAWSTYIYLQNADGTLAAAQQVAMGGAVMELATADFDGDGDIDIASANFNHSVSIRLNQGNGVFSGGQTLAAGTNNPSIAAGDVNGDGRVDLITNSPTDGLKLLVNQGNGTFGAAVTITTALIGNSPTVSLVDVNGDGKADILSGTNAGQSVLLSNGDGTFRTTYSGGGTNAAAGDVTGDGIADLIVSHAFANTVQVLEGRGDGSFNPATTTYTMAAPTEPVVGDMNNDGYADLVIESQTSGLHILINNGKGLFTETASVPANVAGSGQYAPGIGDINGDGVLDVLPYRYIGAADTRFSIHYGDAAPTMSMIHIDLTTETNARTAMTNIAQTNQRVEAEIAHLGALMSRVDAALAHLNSTKDTLAGATSRIMNADVAEETAKLLKSQVLQQMSTALLAQANQGPGLALKLL